MPVGKYVFEATVRNIESSNMTLETTATIAILITEVKRHKMNPYVH